MRITILAIFLSIIGFAQTADMNISYGEHPQQEYDVYFPSEWNEQTPILVFIHGGGWSATGVQRARYQPFINKLLLTDDLIVINIDYRLVQNGGDIYVFPHQVEDIASAVSKVKEDYNLQSNKVYMSGNSAGGHLSFWMYFNQTIPIEGIIPIVAPYKGDVIESNGNYYFENTSGRYQDFVTNYFISPEVIIEEGFTSVEDGIAYASPHTYANPNLGNIFAVFGVNDRSVPQHQVDALLEDYPDVYWEFRGSGHGGWATNLLLPTEIHEFIFQQSETQCVLPVVLEMTRTSPTTATVTFSDSTKQYQGSANRAGRPLRPYPLYGMDNMNYTHTQSALVPAFDYDIWFRTICSDGTYSDWTEAHYLPTFQVPREKVRYFNIQGQEVSPQNLRGIIIINDGNKSYKIYKK